MLRRPCRSHANMLLVRGRPELLTVCLHGCKRSRFVGLHEPRNTDHVGSENGRQSVLRAFGPVQNLAKLVRCRNSPSADPSGRNIRASEGEKWLRIAVPATPAPRGVYPRKPTLAAKCRESPNRRQESPQVRAFH